MKTKNIIMTGIFAALMIISSYIVVPIGVVPHTLQPLIVLLSGILLGPKYGPLSIIVWIILGCLGLPVFNQGQAGVGMLFGPTGGFIVSFIVGSGVAGYLTEHSSNKSLGRNIAYMVFSMLVIYVVGAIGFMFNFTYFLNKPMTWEKTFILAVAPFLPFDIIKAVIAAYVGGKVRKSLIAAGQL